MEIKNYTGVEVDSTKFAEHYRRSIIDNDKIRHNEGQFCVHCGDKISTGHIIRRGHCFGCDFWLDVSAEYQELKPNESVALCNNIYASNETGKIEEAKTLYHFFAGKFNGQWLGSGGRLISFEYPDGQIVQSNNVGCRGQVPPHFTHLFEKFSAKIVDKGWVN